MNPVDHSSTNTHGTTATAANRSGTVRAVTLIDRDAGVIAGIEKLRFFDLAAVGGSGSRLRLEDGREALDLSASWGAASLGNAHPEIAAAVGRASADMPGASILSLVNGPAVELAERILATLGGGDRRVWLGHSGSDANDTAVRALTAATGRPRVISFERAYHGALTGSIAISGHPALDQGEKAAGLIQLPYPDPRDDEAADAVLEELEAQLARHGEQVAACFVEPILSDGGLIVPPSGFLAGLSERCRAHGVLLVCDEVKVGLARSGTLHAFQIDDVEPDVVCLGKGLGGGLPLSAVVGPASVMDHTTAFSLMTTAGNPVCAAAGLTVLEVIERDGLAARAAEAGERFRAGLRGLGSPLVRDVRGRGLAIGVELAEPGSGLKVCFRAAHLGAVFYYVGTDVLELTPALTISDAELDEGVELIGRALADVADGVVTDADVAAYAAW
jgi:4-aminobutyrate aminotransferase